MALQFQAFMDESQSHEEFVLGGYIQTAETWAKFAADWERILPFGTKAKNGKYHFHMTEMAYFRKIGDVPKFYEVIDHHKLFPVSFRMNMVSFRNAMARMDEFCRVMNWSIDWGPWSNPYFFSFRKFLEALHNNKFAIDKAVPLEEKIDFYFDDRSESAPILTAWSEIRAEMPEQMAQHFGANPRFENDQDFLALQAADLWAWWVRRWFEEDDSDPPARMRDFDFDGWKGKNNRYFGMTIEEESIFETFRSVAVENFAMGNFDPMTAARHRGEL